MFQTTNQTCISVHFRYNIKTLRLQCEGLCTPNCISIHGNLLASWHLWPFQPSQDFTKGPVVDTLSQIASQIAAGCGGPKQCHSDPQAEHS